MTQILNFGLPSPIDIQIEGNNIQANHDIAEKITIELHQVSGLTDLHIQQPIDYPTLNVVVDRTKALQAGYQEKDVASSVLNSLSGSFQITPMFFVNWTNGVNYNLVAQTPQYRIQSIKDIRNIPYRRSLQRQSGDSGRYCFDETGQGGSCYLPLQRSTRDRYLRDTAGPRSRRREWRGTTHRRCRP